MQYLKDFRKFKYSCLKNTAIWNQTHDFCFDGRVVAVELAGEEGFVVDVGRGREVLLGRTPHHASLGLGGIFIELRSNLQKMELAKDQT